MILGQLGDQRFDLGDISLLFHVAPQNLQLIAPLSGDSAQKEIFSRLLQHGKRVGAQLIKYPVSQTLKAQDVNIHDSMAGMKPHKLLLSLHGKLFRHDNQKFLGRTAQRFLNNLLIKQGGFSASRVADDKL